MPCFARMLCICRATSASMPGRMRSRNSTTVTSAPSRRHTEPSSSPMTPAPTTSRRFGHLRQRQRAGRGDDRLLVDVDAGQLRHARAGGDDDRLGLELLLLAVDERDLDLARRRRCAAVPWKCSILFFFNRNATPSTLPFTPSSLKASISCKIELRLDLDAHAGEAVARLLEALGRVQQRLRRDAADVEAGAAVRRPLLDDGDLHAELAARMAHT